MGDAQLGDHTNIGGTITANYDGVHKEQHRHHRLRLPSKCRQPCSWPRLKWATMRIPAPVPVVSPRRAELNDTMVYSENTQHNVEGWKPAWER